MDRQHTQFWVAIIGMSGLATVTILAVAATIYSDFPRELAYMLAGSLVSITSTAAAWLFRLNGKG